jgi:hypothetical protein
VVHGPRAVERREVEPLARISAAVLAASVLLAVWASASEERSPPGRIYSADEAERLSVGSYAHGLEDATPYWTPTDAEIRVLEAALPEFLAKSWPADRGRLDGLEQYRRQYFGLSREGRRVIFVNAFCGPFAETLPDWQKRLVTVSDGGGCFFQVYYDPSTKEFRDLRVNGPC